MNLTFSTLLSNHVFVEQMLFNSPTQLTEFPTAGNVPDFLLIVLINVLGLVVCFWKAFCIMLSCLVHGHFVITFILFQLMLCVRINPTQCW